jgi:hypothetical protein
MFAAFKTKIDSDDVDDTRSVAEKMKAKYQEVLATVEEKQKEEAYKELRMENQLLIMKLKHTINDKV